MTPNNHPALQDILIASEGGKLYHFDSTQDRLRLIFEDDKNETLMGLAKQKENIFIGSKSRIFKIRINNKEIQYFPESVKATPSFNDVPDFHQINVIKNALYVTATAKNEIWIFDLDLNLIKILKIKPPRRFLKNRYKTNYNHINNIFFYNNNFYVCLNWLKRKQYGPSGYAVLNNDLKETQRLEYGWEAHNFVIIDDQKAALCGSSGAIKCIRHDHKAGLMIDGKLAFEHDPNQWFCKDFSIDYNYIIIVGGSVKHRDERQKTNGVIFILKRNLEILSRKEFTGSGGFCGCLLLTEDLSKN